MDVNYSHTLTTSIFMENAKAELFELFDDIYEDADEGHWIGEYAIKAIMRTFGALATGAASALITLTTKVATLGEIALKCLAAFIDGDWEFGLKHIVAFVFAVGDLAIGAPLHMIYSLVVDTLGLAISPDTYAHNRKMWHARTIVLLESAKTQFGAKLKTQSLTRKCGNYKKEAPLLEKISAQWNYGVVKSLREGIGCQLNNLIYGDPFAVFNPIDDSASDSESALKA